MFRSDRTEGFQDGFGYERATLRTRSSRALIGAAAVMVVGLLPGCETRPVETPAVQGPPAIATEAPAIAKETPAIKNETPAAGTGDPTADKGITPCPAGPVENYLASEQQQCWHQGPHGRWRILNHELHYDTVVMEAEASSLADADEIARRLVELHGERFQELLLYVQEESSPATARIRRIQWTRGGGYDSLEFTGSLSRR